MFDQQEETSKLLVPSNYNLLSSKSYKIIFMCVLTKTPMLKPLLKNTARPFLALKKTNHRYGNLFRKRSRTLCCTRVTLCVKGSWKDLTSMDLTSKLSMKGQKVLICPKRFLFVCTHCLGMNYYVNFLGGISSNGFHIK